MFRFRRRKKEKRLKGEVRGYVRDGTGGDKAVVGKWDRRREDEEVQGGERGSRDRPIG